MVLELIAIGGVVYYYAKKHEKKKRAQAAALLAPPPNTNTYQSLPAYPGTLPPVYRDAEYKQQMPTHGQRDMNMYHASPAPAYPITNEKAPLMETREVKY